MQAPTQQSEFTAIWTADAAADAADDVGTSSVTHDVPTPQQGPLTAAIETTAWTRDDIELAVSIANGVVLLLTLYTVVSGGDGL